MTAELTWTSAELGNALASAHRIDSTRATELQSRLKGLHRLGFPAGLRNRQGDAVHYTPLQVVETALAVELIQLGIAPERVSFLLVSNRWAMLMAIELVARDLRADPDAWSADAVMPESALPIFLFFDPGALHALTAPLAGDPSADKEQESKPFFHFGAGIVSEDIAQWTSRGSARLSLINLSVMIAQMAAFAPSEGSDSGVENRSNFFRSLERQAAAERSGS